MEGPLALAGLTVGALVGVTGVGGGALMTPLLVLLFGVAPHTAVGTDLLYASVTKIFGVAMHHNHGTVDWRVVKRLAWGSIPAATLTLLWMQLWGVDRLSGGVIINAVAIALLVTAVGMLFRDQLHGLGRKLQLTRSSRLRTLQTQLTVFAGIVLGIVVTLTSIGAGALGTVMLVYLYPARLPPNRLVGTDLAHAIPLALLAGLGHLTLGNVDFMLLVNLLVGSIPGVLIGALISTRAPLQFIRHAIALVLALVAVKMLLG